MLSTALPGGGELILRLVFACCAGFIIGLERSLRSKEAGPRTHSLIACGAALFMILSKYAFFDLAGAPSNSGMDGSMIACQIVNGVTFLGAGLIFKGGRYAVSGLTTATGIWFSAAVGMACGCGLEALALFSAVFIVLLQWLFHKTKIGGASYAMQTVQFTLLNTPRIWKILYRHQRRLDVEIISAKVIRLPDNHIDLTLRVIMKRSFTFEQSLRMIDKYPEIESITT